jgi:hypothetical protein
MIGISEKEAVFTNQALNYDFDLGIVGFKYSDLFDAERLGELAEKFYDELAQENALLHKALIEYIETGGAGYESRVESNILTRFGAVSFAFYSKNVRHHARARGTRNFNPRARPDLEIQIFRSASRDKKISGG